MIAEQELREDKLSEIQKLNSVFTDYLRDGTIKNVFKVCEVRMDPQELLTSVPFLLVLLLKDVRFFLRVEFLKEL